MKAYADTYHTKTYHNKINFYNVEFGKRLIAEIFHFIFK